ncbi:MAG: hypothetical protein Q9M97_05805 [Candidatus Gracilibacteria bacterium]|nr:hypothetical protein [Candidatus Gracilibacteria bacterium]
MKIPKILKQIKKLEKQYSSLEKEIKINKLLNSELNSYLEKDKQDFKKLWIKYINFFLELQKLIKVLKYRRFFFFINYNNLLLRKYILIFYFNSIIKLRKSFGENEEFIRTFLGENFKKDYETFAKYIYKPNYINLINTPILFIKAFSKLIEKKYIIYLVINI